MREVFRVLAVIALCLLAAVVVWVLVHPWTVSAPDLAPSGV